MNRLFIGIILGFVLSSSLSAQGTWFSLFQKLVDQETGSEIIESGREYNGNLYNAKIRFVIRDGDGNANNFTNNDNINFEIQGTDLSFNGNKDGLIAFAEANGQAIYDAIFKSDISGEVNGNSDPQSITQSVVKNIIFASPSKQKDKSKNFVTLSDINIHAVSTRIEISAASVGEKDENVMLLTAVPSYSYNFGEFMQHSVGVLLPIKYADQDDKLQSKSFAISLTPFIRYRIFEKDSAIVEQDYFSIDIGFSASLHSTFVNSTIFGGAGYLRYGGSFFTSAQWEPFQYLNLKFALAYQINKVDVPEFIVDGLVSEDFDWLVSTIKGLPVDHQISFALQAKVPITDKIAATMGYMRTHNIGERSESSTAYMSVFSIFFDFLVADLVDLSVGYKTVFEIEDYTEHTLLLGGMLNF